MPRALGSEYNFYCGLKDLGGDYAVEHEMILFLCDSVISSLLCAICGKWPVYHPTYRTSYTKHFK